MLSLLDALWQGRAYELPDNKDSALTFLAREISAVALVDGKEFMEQIIARESGHNCSIGFGVACPHAGVLEPGDLICAIGWNPSGLDYGACNGMPVHLLIMYRIPDARRNAYLQEMAAISRAIKAIGEKPITNEKDRTNFFKVLVEQTESLGSPPNGSSDALNRRWNKITTQR